MQEQTTLKHSVSVEQRKSITVSGVESVTAFSEVKIALALIGNERLQVVGTGLKITGFSKSSGTFTAEGSISGLHYGGSSLAAKLFK